MKNSINRLWSVFALLLLSVAASVNAQDKPKAPQDDDVVRVSTTLVQTDVMVFDKQNNFVEGLKPEQFQVKIDGQPVSVSFVEMVTTGSAQEKAQIADARGGRPLTVTGGTTPSPLTVVEGRSLFLFVDDLHLNGESLIRTKKLLSNTVDEMTANDRAMLIAASGQLGPQNLSNDKTALKATIARMALMPGVRQQLEAPPMSEGAAIAINRGDRAVLDYYVRRLRDPAVSQEEVIKGRAAQIIERAAPFASNTLTALESFVRELANVPGRKLLFFISDGFMIENELSMSYARLRGATDEAARGGVVIYSLNARGLVTQFPDASIGDGFDPALARAVYGADKELQEVLYSLAYDTGGRPFVNINDMNIGIRQALAETSRYYLLAWSPSAETTARGKVKSIKIDIVGRSDLKVRTRKGIAEAITTSLTASSINPLSNLAAAAGGELMTALTGNLPLRDIPAAVVLAYRKTPPSNFALSASMQLPTSALTFEDVQGRKVATLDVAGIVQDQSGKQISNFNKRISVAADSNAIDSTRKVVFYNYDAGSLPPGSYQVRVGVRDSKNGRMGSVTQTVVIPELSTGELALSSLMLNEHTEADDDESSSDKVGVRKGVARHFAGDSQMRFLTYVYNAAPTAADDPEPNLNVEVKVLRGAQPVLNPALRELEIDRGTDTKTYPYLAEIPLTGLTPGEYTLEVVVTDLTKKSTATQRATFIVD